MESEWKQKNLGDLITIKHGFAFKGEFFSEEITHFQLVTPGNFSRGGGFQLGKGKYYSGKIPEDYVLKKGDVVVTMTDLSETADTLGYAAVIPHIIGTTWLHNQRIGLVKLKQNAPARLGYIHYLMRSKEYRHWVISSATGSTLFKHTSPTRICNFKFYLPPVRSQDFINNTLSAIDDRITLLRETNTTLEAMAQTLFKSWFVNFDPVQAKQQGRSPDGIDAETSALFPCNFEMSELGEIPKGWRICRIDEFIELAYGKALKATDRFSGDVPVYGSGGIIGFHNQCLVNGPSIIIGRKGTVGTLYWEDQNFFPIDTVFYIRTSLPLTYCYYLLQTLSLKDMNTDTAVPGLNRSNVYRLTVPYADEFILSVFDNIVKPIRDQIFRNTQQAQTLAKLRDTLLPRLISGQLLINSDSRDLGEAA